MVNVVVESNANGGPYYFSVRRDRSFGDYTKELGLIGGLTLTDLLLDKARQKLQVTFYDIGCGEGNVAHGLHEALADRAEEKGLNRGLADRVVYIGIDAYTGDNWHNSYGTRFYEGSILEILRTGGLPPIDVGFTHEVIPYLDRKLEALEIIANMLCRENGRGVFIAKPFYRDQLLLSADGIDLPLSVSKAFGGTVDVIDEAGNRLVIKPSPAGRAQLGVQFLKSEEAFWQFTKNFISGNPGQKVSYYSQ